MQSISGEGKFLITNNTLEKYLQYFGNGSLLNLNTWKDRESVLKRVLALLSPGISEGPVEERVPGKAHEHQDVYYYPSRNTATHRIIVRGDDNAVVQIEEVSRRGKMIMNERRATRITY